MEGTGASSVRDVRIFSMGLTKLQAKDLSHQLKNLGYSVLLLASIISHCALAGPLVLDFPRCEPETESSDQWSDFDLEPSKQFCARWNPDFAYNGHQCCPARGYRRKGKRKSAAACTPAKKRGSYCKEMTPDQIAYDEKVSSGRIPDVLEYLTQQMGKNGQQAFCSVNNGFLVNGRRVIPSPANRIEIQHANRCLEFGTDSMVAMLEWLGRQVGAHYAHAATQNAGPKIVLGNISGPKGGCLLGKGGRRGHLSHTSGQDADIGFLSVSQEERMPARFTRKFDAKTNWWFIQHIFRNPFACVKVIFLDRSHIRSLAKVAKGDELWSHYSRFVRHMPGHRNHLHVRVGNGPGLPGCVPGASPESEVDEADEGNEEIELDVTPSS